MNTQTGVLDTLIQQKIDADNDFQDSLVDLSDEDKATAISERKSELANELFEATSKESEKNKELANNYKVRAEKAEKVKTDKAGEGNPNNNPTAEEKNLSTRDMMALLNANVPEEDMDEVIDYASYKKISIAEALKSDVVKNTLSINAETRKSAEASNTGAGKPGSSKLSEESLINKARKGEMPQSDGDISRLASAMIKKSRQ